MKPIRNRKRLLFSAMALAALTVSACSSDPGATPTSFPSAAPEMSSSDASWSFDITDPALLAGASDAIFVGTVIEQMGTKALSKFPETQFLVRIADGGVLKGDVSGDITVNQQGGLQPDGTMVLLDDDEMVTVGQSYLFATGYLPSEGWYTVVPHSGHQLITDDEVSVLENNSRSRGAPQEEPAGVAHMRDAIAEGKVPDAGEDLPPVNSEPDGGHDVPSSIPPTTTVTPTPTR